MTEKTIQEKSKHNVQELYMQLNMMNQQMTDLQKQIQVLEDTISELKESKIGIKEISESKLDREILVPIISGIFAKAKLDSNSEFIVNIGANTLVTKSAKGVTELLDNQLVDMQKTQDNFMAKLQDMANKAKQIETGLKAFATK
jgi:prefoldin alpha subunit